MYGNNEMVIDRVILTEIPGRKEVEKRNTVVNGDINVMNNFKASLYETKDQYGTSSIFSKATINKHASQLIGVDTKPSEIIQIPNGWDTKRLNFLIIMRNATTGYIYVLQGYSNFLDMSYNKTLNPEIELIVNNVIEVMPIMRNDGSFSHYEVVDNYNIIAEPNGRMTVEKVGTEVISEYKAARPIDVVLNIKHIDVPDTNNRVGQLTNVPIVTRNNNRNPYEHLGISITKLGTSKEYASEYDTMDEILSNTAIQLEEPTLASNEAYRLVKTIHNFDNDFYLTIGDLDRIEPGIMNTNKVIYKETNLNRIYANNTIQNETLVDNIDTSMEAAIATQVNEGILGIASDNILLEFSFTINSLNRREAVYTPMPIPPTTLINGLNPIPLVNSAMKTFADTVFAPMTKLSLNRPADVIPMEVIVDFKLFGDTFITVTLDGGIPYTKAFPNMCSSLSNPFVLERDSLTGLSANYNGIVENILDVHDN